MLGQHSLAFHGVSCLKSALTADGLHSILLILVLQVYKPKYFLIAAEDLTYSERVFLSLLLGSRLWFHPDGQLNSTTSLCHCPSSTEENMMEKGSRTEIRAGRSPISYHHS